MREQLLLPIITFLEQKGATEEEIAETIADVIQSSTVLLYKEAMDTFSDEDIQKIEDAPDDQAANTLITKLYAQKVGTSPDELLNVFLKEFVKNFLEEQNQTLV